MNTWTKNTYRDEQISENRLVRTISCLPPLTRKAVFRLSFIQESCPCQACQTRIHRRKYQPIKQPVVQHENSKKRDAWSAADDGWISVQLFSNDMVRIPKLLKTRFWHSWSIKTPNFAWPYFAKISTQICQQSPFQRTHQFWNRITTPADPLRRELGASLDLKREESCDFSQRGASKKPAEGVAFGWVAGEIYGNRMK